MQIEAEMKRGGEEVAAHMLSPLIYSSIHFYNAD